MHYCSPRFVCVSQCPLVAERLKTHCEQFARGLLNCEGGGFISIAVDDGFGGWETSTSRRGLDLNVGRLWDRPESTGIPEFGRPESSGEFAWRLILGKWIVSCELPAPVPELTKLLCPSSPISMLCFEGEEWFELGDPALGFGERGFRSGRCGQVGGSTGSSPGGSIVRGVALTAMVFPVGAARPFLGSYPGDESIRPLTSLSYSHSNAELPVGNRDPVGGDRLRNTAKSRASNRYSREQEKTGGPALPNKRNP